MSEISDFISNNIKFSDNIKKYLEITYSIKDGLYDSVNVGALDNKQFEHVKINNALFYTFDPYFTIHYFDKEIILGIWFDDLTEAQSGILLSKDSMVIISVDDNNPSTLSIDITSK